MMSTPANDVFKETIALSDRPAIELLKEFVKKNSAKREPPRP
jgi:hypothetical protein